MCQTCRERRPRGTGWTATTLVVGMNVNPPGRRRLRDEQGTDRVGRDVDVVRTDDHPDLPALLIAAGSLREALMDLRLGATGDVVPTADDLLPGRARGIDDRKCASSTQARLGDHLQPVHPRLAPSDRLLVRFAADARAVDDPDVAPGGGVAGVNHLLRVGDRRKRDGGNYQ